MRVLDLFCGLGGFSTGAAMAGAEVVGGVDIDPWAAAAFQASHQPDEEHVADITAGWPHAGGWRLGSAHAADLESLPPSACGADIDCILASPPCQDHSMARGGRPVVAARQALPWRIVPWVQHHRPRWVVVENVPRIRRWGGWNAWVLAMLRAGDGYRFTPVVLDAAAFGVPQHRRRLFMVFTRRDLQRQFRWGLRPPPPQPVMPASMVLDPPGVHPWRALADKCPRTVARSHRAFEALGRPEQFLISYYSGGGWSGNYARRLSAPLATITTRDRFALVRGMNDGMTAARLRMLQPSEVARGMGFADIPWPAGFTRRRRVQLLGNAVSPPVAAWLVSQLWN